MPSLNQVPLLIIECRGHLINFHLNSSTNDLEQIRLFLCKTAIKEEVEIIVSKFSFTMRTSLKSTMIRVALTYRTNLQPLQRHSINCHNLHNLIIQVHAILFLHRLYNLTRHKSREDFHNLWMPLWSVAQLIILRKYSFREAISMLVEILNNWEPTTSCLNNLPSYSAQYSNSRIAISQTIV